MNFFFGFNNDHIKSNLTIPKFNNNSIYKDCSIYSAKPIDNKWIIEKINCYQNNHFFFLENKFIKNDLLFFLANDSELKNFSYSNITDFSSLNNFTDTKPSAFRANFKIYIDEGGFSSYQSEYPYSMTLKTGNILSPIHNLLNKEADKNIILFRNIYCLPNHNESKIYIFNIETKKILKTETIKNNFSNQIEISKDLINQNIYIFSELALGIPLFITIKNLHISFEHTHPPHHYILSENQFRVTGRIKKEIKELINADHQK